MRRPSKELHCQRLNPDLVMKRAAAKEENKTREVPQAVPSATWRVLVHSRKALQLPAYARCEIRAARVGPNVPTEKAKRGACDRAISGSQSSALKPYASAK